MQHHLWIFIKEKVLKALVKQKLKYFYYNYVKREIKHYIKLKITKLLNGSEISEMVKKRELFNLYKTYRYPSKNNVI